MSIVATCLVRTDCARWSGIPSTDVCFLGVCGPDPPACTTPCSGDLRGLTCVHSGIQAHCDGCTHDSACLSKVDCKTITGKPCAPDLDAGPWSWPRDAAPWTPQDAGACVPPNCTHITLP